MNDNKIDDLRAHLFATLAALRDPEKPMEIDRAKAVAEVARAVIDTAKVEVEYVKVTGTKGSGFIPELPAPEGKPGQPRLVKGRDSRG
jgi:hypothetical protein